MSIALAPSRSLPRQFGTFLAVGASAFVVHYGLLIGGVEWLRLDPVIAALLGYAGGGLVSYALNRRHTYASARPHAEAAWRFAIVAGIGFGLTFLLMAALTRRAGLGYLPAQLLTTGLVLFWNFLAHKLWTFAVRTGPVPSSLGGTIPKEPIHP